MKKPSIIILIKGKAKNTTEELIISYKTEEDRDKDLEEFNNANSEKHLKFKKDIISIRTTEGDD